MLAFAWGSLRVGAPLIEVRWLWTGFGCVYLSADVSGGRCCRWRCNTPRSEDPIVRRQLKWLRNGAIFGILPFALIYVLPYLFGVVPTHA